MRVRPAALAAHATCAALRGARRGRGPGAPGHGAAAPTALSSRLLLDENIAHTCAPCVLVHVTCEPRPDK